jgi:CRP-like cAMP-binding protein
MNSAFLALQQYLSALPLSEPVIRDVLGCFTIKTLMRNDYFARAGEVHDRLGFVAEGLFVMSVEKPGQPEFVKNFLTNSEFLLATFDPQSENLVNIQALQDSRILEARYSDIQALNSRHPDFRMLSERGMQKRYQQICDRLEQMATLNASGRYEVFRNAFSSLEDRIPQYLVASYVGVTPTQLSRIRKNTKTA